ncbi:O-methyltransferase [Catenulispora yoronensis]
MYESEDAWRDVDAYFVDMLLVEDEALTAARESGHKTTMPRAEVAPRASFLRCCARSRARLAYWSSAPWPATAPSGWPVRLADLAGGRRRRSQSARRLIEQGAQPFDFVFIDADKPSNPEYLRASLALTAPGSVIVIDNVVRNGAVTDPESTDDRVRGVRTVLADIARDPRLDATALQTVGFKGWDGFTIIRRTR